MEKIHDNMHVFMLSCIKHACFDVFSPFSAYFFAHDIIAEKGPLFLCLLSYAILLVSSDLCTFSVVLPEVFFLTVAVPLDVRAAALLLPFPFLLEARPPHGSCR